MHGLTRYMPAFNFPLREKCFVYLLVTSPISWNMFAAFSTLCMSHVIHDVDAGTFNTTV